MMKKVTSIVIMIVMVFSLVACGNTNNNENAKVTMPESSESGQLENEQIASNENKILVAYYSHSGNTESVANQIAELTGADLAKIDRAEAYPEDFYDIAKQEIKDGEQPEITVDVEDISSYNTVFVGYPIWYDEAPAVIVTFLEQNDFAGKRVIPFCTSSSDEIDSTLHIFTELSPNATIAGGVRVTDETDIATWMKELGLF